ncbi:exodeoxyribonuclease V subunit gamma [Aquipuribacter hungaricus]|uniref:exodeoxyribonuclease V subunit gamma n=1 Tax=Aquipuribacter hungaricus TaxID=545624 RepID=UPI003616761F
MLVVHRAESATVLADALAELLATPLDDPFATELVAVPARGVERWLAQRLAHRLGASGSQDGVCAGVEFPSPYRLLTRATATVAPEQTEALQAWTPERLVWPLLRAVDDAVTEDWARVLRRHLYLEGQPVPSQSTGRRLSLAASVARLFHSYARNRPQMLRRWAAGHPVLPDGGPLGTYELWQHLLWNRLREELGTSPVDLQAEVCDVVRRRPDDLDVPRRVSVFGASRLSRVDLDVMAALAEHREVHLWLHHASPALWEHVAGSGPVVRRADDNTGTSLGNPLLASLSRDLRELQHLLGAHVPDHADVHHPSGRAGSDLLSRLREDLALDRVPADPPALDPADRSVQVHACHGRTRQVEVLREVVVGLLADDPTLEPRDVLVMCPDVEAFAPLLAAAFATRGEEAGSTDGTHPAARLRVRVADRALHQANPLLAVLDRLLDLGTARLTATEVLDLAGHPAVARRFGFDDDELERLRDWTAASGTRWGLHEGHRAGWSLQRVPDGTWRRGIDRILLGAAVDPGQGMEAATLGGLVPLDDVDSSDIDLAGRFAELLDRLDAAHAGMAVARTPEAWADLLEEAVLQLAAHEADGAWQELQLRDVLLEALVEGAEGDEDGASTGVGSGAGTAADRPGASLSLVECDRCCEVPWPGGRPRPGSAPAR